MKILYHHRTLGDGAEGIHVASIVEALRGLGHDVKVASLIGEQTNVTTARTRLLTRITRTLPRAAYEALELGYSAVAFRTLSRHVASWRPDLLYERYSLFNFAGVLAARRTGVPIALEVNAPVAYERAAYERLALRRVARRCEASICLRADVVITVSTPLRDHLVELGVRKDRIVVMPNGADPDRFRPDAAARADVRARHGIDSHAVVVGFTGILRPWHGVDLLLTALAQARAAGPPLHALIVGDGPSLPALRALAASSGLAQAVTFTGRVPHEAVPRYIAAFDIGVSPRATFYASPMKIPEYMASGIAVVAPRGPNFADLLDDGVEGDFFEPENANELAAVLRRLADDPDRRLRLARAARAAIVTRRSWRHNAARIIELAAPARLCA